MIHQGSAKQSEAAMATTEYVLDSLTQLDRYVRLIAAAPGVSGITDVARAYLAGWSKERIRSLQTIDAGWAPFDENQRPEPIYDADGVRRICKSVRDQCLALRASGVELTPELLELDLFFFFACESVEVHEPTYAIASSSAMPQVAPHTANPLKATAPEVDHV